MKYIHTVKDMVSGKTFNVLSDTDAPIEVLINNEHVERDDFVGADKIQYDKWIADFKSAAHRNAAFFEKGHAYIQYITIGNGRADLIIIRRKATRVRA